MGHGSHPATSPPDLDRDSFRADQLARFWWFICERQTIWQRRVAEGQAPPWTSDPILQTQRFTNVYRELDPGTQYAIQAILERDAPLADTLFNLMLYRLIGRVETHARLGFQRAATFDPDHLRRTLRAIRAEGQPPFTAAYIVSGYRSMGSRDKIENVARIFARLSQSIDDLEQRIRTARSAAAVYEALVAVDGFGPFLAYQVLVDLLYPVAARDGQPLLPFSHDDWAMAGPGARRGITMLLPPGARHDPLQVMRWLQDEQHREFARLGLDFPYLRDAAGAPIPISLANIQNCLCEFHKYVKISDGTGRGRRRFTPRPDEERSWLAAWPGTAHQQTTHRTPRRG